MNLSTEFIRIETLFNSVEAELARRWIGHDVPAHFAHRPVAHLRKVVNAWWHMYHESICAGLAVDRSIWERKGDHPAEPLDTPALIESLEQIHRLINLGGLLSFRSIHAAEIAAICLLANMVRYYAESFYQRSKSMNPVLVIFATMDDQNTPLELTNDQLKAAALRYVAVLSKAVELLPSADQSLLSGTAGVTYLKQKGHKPLTGEDTEAIIQSLGTVEDKTTIRQFTQAQVQISKRLMNNKWIVLIAEQAKLPYYTINRRVKKPSGWKAEEIIQVVDVLQRLQV